MRVRPFYMLVTTPNGARTNWVKELYLGGPAMDEDKREKIRSASSEWVNLNRSVYPLGIERDVEIWQARERARLTVLDLTEFDRRLLHQCKVSPD